MNEFKQGAERAVRDELSAAAFYTQLALRVPNAELRAILQSIAADENGHARTFATVVNLDPLAVAAPAWGQPGSFAEGVRTALQGELAAVSEYAQLALLAPNGELRNLVMSILADEFGHARIFAAMLGLLYAGGQG